MNSLTLLTQDLKDAIDSNFKVNVDVNCGLDDEKIKQKGLGL